MLKETVVGVSHILPHLRGHLLQDFYKIEGGIQRFVELKMSQQSEMTSFESGISTFACNQPHDDDDRVDKFLLYPLPIISFFS
jgi:hypothetical protein